MSDRSENMRRRTSLSFLNSVVVGIVAGTLVIGLRFAFFALDNLRQEIVVNPSILYKILWVVLVIGIVFLITFLLKHHQASKQSGEDQIQAQLLGLSKPNSFNVIVSKIIGTLGSVFGGLPLGHGGPSMQIGAHVGKVMTPKNRKDTEKTMMLSGQAAGFAGAFSTPLSGLIFNIELVNRSFTLGMALPALTASIIADLLARHVFSLPPLFNIVLDDLLPFDNYHYIILLAILVSLCGVFFNFIVQQSSRLKINRQYYIWFSFGLAILLFFVFPQALGPIIDFGSNNITLIISLLILRYVFTLTTYQSNAMGGLFLPLMMIGGLIGQLFGSLLIHFEWMDMIYINNMVVFGMAAMLSATLKSPLFAIVFIAEITGAPLLVLPLAISSLISTMIASNIEVLPLYSYQLSQVVGIRPEVNTMDRVVTQVYLSLDSDLHQMRIMDIKLPAGVLIISIYRYGKEINVDGKVRLQAGDLVSLVSREDQQYLITQMFH